MGSFPDFFWNITDSSRFGNLSAKLVVHRRKNTVTDDSDRLVTLNQIFVYIYNEKSNWIRLFLQFLPIFFWLYVIIFQVHLAQNPDFRYPIHLYLIVELMLLELKQRLSPTDHDWLDLFIDQNYTPPMLKSFSKDEDQGLSRHKYVYTIPKLGSL